MTHDELIEYGRKVLEKRFLCTVILTEMSTSARDEPDGIGWRDGMSFLIEAKATKSDFLADRKKSRHKKPGTCVGDRRYYITPAKLVTGEDLPDGWGLLEVNDKGKIRLIKDSKLFRRKSHRDELRMLISAVRRLGIESTAGANVRVYKNGYDQKKPKASMTITDKTSNKDVGCDSQNCDIEI